eukprot:TRINITY_DN17134_c0_g1_i1.p1 TRINITY_DN17134_c0_g1~~TRINITY_DN17134_c0_g1_i1.p1  ORF type:complete len:94 (-),score=20.47 TRINITY_DN17134_c0_g1_i1:33-314(-)
MDESEIESYITVSLFQKRVSEAIKRLKEKAQREVFLTDKNLKNVIRIAEGFFGETFKAEWKRPGKMAQLIVVKVSKKGPAGMEWNELSTLRNI